jgi:hypothetical protein
MTRGRRGVGAVRDECQGRCGGSVCGPWRRAVSWAAAMSRRACLVVGCEGLHAQAALGLIRSRRWRAGDGLRAHSLGGAIGPFLGGELLEGT